MKALQHPVAGLALLTALMLAGPVPQGRAQDDPDDEPYLPGLVASFRDGKGNTATRVDPQMAFHWRASAPDSRLAGGEVRATWRGHLRSEGRGDYRFLVHGTGEVELKVAGRVVIAVQELSNGWCESPPVALAPDYHAFELSFRRTGDDARLMLLWSGPQFGPEPVPPRALVHRREQTVGRDFERGELLARVLRCGRCHGEQRSSEPGPALDRLADNLSRDWLGRWLVAGEQRQWESAEARSPRRMPAFGLSQVQAEAVADWLLAGRPPDSAQPAPPPAVRPQKKEPKSRPSARSGERLFVSLGCLACHTWRDLGASGWLGGGDLTHVADKRPAGFFAAWLSDPARLNADHRMPVFALSDDECTSLVLFLAEQKADKSKPLTSPAGSPERRTEGAKLIQQFRCGSCHRLPEPSPERPPARLDCQSNWDQSCLGAPDTAKQRPGYRLAEADARAVRLYYSGRTPSGGDTARPDGRLLLVEHNCLACHQRDGTREGIPLLPALLSDKLTAVAKHYPDLAPLVPALTPPALNSVGDKLNDTALAEAIARRGEPHRPYLQVRMPRFNLREDDLQALVQYFVAGDRVPERTTATAPPVDRTRRDRYVLAGGRLVSSDGFGCTSCHQAGSVLPSQAPLNALGPDLSRMDRRIRRPWFDRWLRNPARIVPRMEMPSVQIPVTGVLDNNLEEQVAAVWHVLNQPGFEPPPPGPVRTLRHHGNSPDAPPLLVTDVLQSGGRTWVKPFLVGLANRHNVLLDLETARLGLWTVGDTVRQRTKGKSWFWELAGTTVLDPGLSGADLALVLSGGVERIARPIGQFLTEADAWEVTANRIVLRYRLLVGDPRGDKPSILHVQRTLRAVPGGFAQELSVVGLVPSGGRVRLRVLSAGATGVARSADGRVILLGDRFASRIRVQEPEGARFTEDGTGLLLSTDGRGMARVVLHYLSDIPVDRFPDLPAIPEVARKAEPVSVAPGFVGERLPLPADIMPTGLAWRPDGRLVFCSLKGQVFEAVDSNGDGAADRLEVLADGLPAPYGIHARSDYVDVAAKYALLRVWDSGLPHPAEKGEKATGRRVEALASGWGYTADYHDWAVGLPQNRRGEYFLGIPCQQDKRPEPAGHFRGTVLRLLPRKPTAENPQRFTLEPVSAGHRFPMGLALDRDGELFVTDNQGNYNPFNELNHVRPGVHFGFINTLDKGKPTPPLEPPAIDIPHPWTRSVNGICFLDTPRSWLGQNVFGPLEGHLVGCEYDTRRLVRMTLQRVGDTFQGAAYPLSVLPLDPRQGFLGPVVCAVSPRGELYVGSIRDSGWGAGNNVGEIVRVRVEPDKLPCGIAEVRAAADGFVIDFFRPINRDLARRPDSYEIQSYRRESTPAYGGPDRDRRTEKVTAVTVTGANRVRLRLAEMRPGFVYEFRLTNLAPGGVEFYPAEAHYTLRVVPK